MKAIMYYIFLNVKLRDMNWENLEHNQAKTLDHIKTNIPNQTYMIKEKQLNAPLLFNM